MWSHANTKWISLQVKEQELAESQNRRRRLSTSWNNPAGSVSIALASSGNWENGNHQGQSIL